MIKAPERIFLIPTGHLPTMTRHIVLIMLFSCCLAAALPAWGRRERGPVIEVVGVVRLVGNGPFTELVITAQDMEWFVEKEEEYKLRDLQQMIVTVEGEETVTSLTFANGMPAGEQRSLRNIRILAAL